MNEIATNRLREAMQRATDLEEVVAVAEAIGREAVTQALTESPRPVVHNPGADEERQRLLDAALGDAIEAVNRHRMRLGRRVCSRPDASVTRTIYEALRSMADATGGADSDPSFQ